MINVAVELDGLNADIHFWRSKYCYRKKQAGTPPDSDAQVAARIAAMLLSLVLDMSGRDNMPRALRFGPLSTLRRFIPDLDARRKYATVAQQLAAVDAAIDRCRAEQDRFDSGSFRYRSCAFALEHLHALRSDVERVEQGLVP